MTIEGVRHRGVVGGLRALRVDVGEIAAHAARLHGLQGLAAELCIEAVTAAALLAAYLDEDERLTLQIQANEPAFAFTADVHEHGAIRARFTPAWVPPPDGPLRGVMLVMKSVVGREVYRGVTALEHSSITEMLQQHLIDSAQAPAQVAIQGGVGAFVERLPDEEVSSDTLTETLRSVLKRLDGEACTLEWACACSRDKVLQMLVALGPEEIRSMIQDDAGARVTCHYCNRVVDLDVPALEGLL